MYISLSRFVYNYFLNLKVKKYEEDNINISFKEIKHKLVLLKRENQF